ncbi:MAG: carboxypeptidase-like regulatory domain-containing protein [Flavobacteriaceae bacterium]|nr:carboxypeptidase-like regulatory domain-containing protein [Flavobacteriaceae bacterium]
MKKHLFIGIVFLLLGQFTFAQTRLLTGVVTDSLKTPLAYTNVLAKPDSIYINMAFAITDEKGRFKLELKENMGYTITVSYLGFKSFEFKIKLSQNATKNIVLKEATNQLEEIILIKELPVNIKKDTITYNTKVFTNGKERKLKQVLKKLPGVEVAKNGSVTVLGKKVTDLLVDGKTFFGGGTKLGVENIPADAVRSVEVLDNYNKVGFLKGLNNSQRMALNIKLKKDKKKFVFGDIEGGKGNGKHYLIHPTLFYYSPKTAVNFIGDVNDIGKKSFTLKDYLDFEGGIGKLLSDPSSYFKLSNSAFAGFLENQDFTAAKNNFAAANITQAINGKIDISGYGILSNTKSTTQNEVLNQYLTNNNSVLESKNTFGNSNNTFAMGKMELTYRPSINDDISYASFFKAANNNNNTNLLSQTKTANTQLNTRKKTLSTTVKQNAEWHKKLSYKHTFSFTANYQYNKSTPNTQWLTNQPILQGLIPLVSDSSFDINQLKYLQINNFGFLFKHYWVINNKNHIYTTLGSRILNEKYQTSEFQNLSDGTQNNFESAGFGNDLDFNLTDTYFGIEHKFKVGKAVLKTGIFGHYYHLKAQQESKHTKNKIVWLPAFTAKYDFSNSEHLNFRYNLKSAFADAPKYAEKFSLLHYNALTKGNPNLDNELYHTARLWYTKFSLYRGIIMNANLSYNKKIHSIRNEIQLQGIDQFTNPVLSRNPENRWQFSTNIRKTISKLTLKIKGNVSTSNYFQSLNNKLFKNKSNIQSLGIALATNVKKGPNFELGYDKRFSQFKSLSNLSKFTNESPYLNLDCDFLKSFKLEADYTRTNYKNDAGLTNRYEVANASLSFQKEDSAWGFKVSGTNIFGVSFKQQNAFSDFLISDTKTFILPRIWLFTLTYKL